MFSFSTRFNTLRTEKGLTLDEFANNTGLSKASLSRYETEKTIPTIQSAYIIAEYFGVSVDWITGLTENRVSATTEQYIEIIEECVKYNIDLKKLKSIINTLKN